jgi:hypothetical protein
VGIGDNDKMIQGLSKVTGQVTRIPDTNQSPVDFKPARNGLPTFRGTTYEDHITAWREVVGAVELDLWKLGAVAASLVKTHGDSDVVKFGKEVGLSKSRIYEIAKTYKTFQISGRSEKLSFSHYEEASASDDPLKTIGLAKEKGWSARQLKRYVETGLEPGEKSDINADVLAMAQPNPESVKTLIPEIQALRDKVMIDFCMEIRRILDDLGTRCPSIKFKSNVIDSWKQELDDHLERFELNSWKDLVIHAWATGRHQENQIAEFAGIPPSQIHGVMKAYEREGIFEKVNRRKTEGAKGVQPWVWHLVGQPLGSDYVRPS